MPIGNIFKEIQFDAGHRIPNHKSKCRHLHGHRYVVIGCVDGEIQEDWGSSSDGMVLDFGDLKAALMKIHDTFDHKMILYRRDPIVMRGMDDDSGVVVVEFVPTAENLAVEIFNSVSRDVPNLASVTVYETPTSWATYERPYDA
jgi:6-pyruvoyltetrahydropterin/6-carboxytetrahydropterin synthase